MNKIFKYLLPCFFCILNTPTYSQLSFSADTLKGCIPLQVSFTNQSSGYNNFEWDFGDGNTSQLSQPIHLYNKVGHFRVRLIGTSSVGSDTLYLSDSILVKAMPTADYRIQNSVHCLGTDSVQFVNLGDTVNQYFWSFGDGSSLLAFEGTYQYATAGSFLTSLTETDTLGCSFTRVLADTVKIYELPNDSFSIDTNLICDVSRAINLLAADTALNFYKWTFGDGTFDSLSYSINHIFQNEGDFEISLQVRDINGCVSRSYSDTVSVSFFREPAYTVSSDTFCTQQQLFLSLDSNWRSAQWFWNDSDSLNGKVIRKIFDRDTNYSAHVDLLDLKGCRFKDTIGPYSVHQSPIAAIGTTPFEACADTNVQLVNNSFYANQYKWQFGFANSTNKNPIINFSIPGNFPLSLIATNRYCADTLEIDDFAVIKGGQPNIQLIDTAGCVPFKLRAEINDSIYSHIKWFSSTGDSTISSIFNYTYNSGGEYHPFVITHMDNCIDTTELAEEILVSDAQFNFKMPDTIFLCRPGSVQFNGTAVGGRFWMWDFGDGDSSNIANPTHFFDSAGIYQVKLITENSYGCHLSCEPYNVVIVKKGEAQFDFVRENCPNFKVSFRSLDSSAVGWRWTFGDGTIDSVENPIHFYPGAGYYTVSLTTWDKNGCFARKTLLNGLEILRCNGSDSIPNGSSGGFGTTVFGDTTATLEVCAPFSVDFSLPVDSIRWHQWNFGNGITCTKEDTTLVYDQKGYYSIELIIQYLDLSYDTLINHNFLKVNKPIAQFDYLIDNYCDSSKFSAINQSIDADSYNWQIGSSNTTLSNPTQLFLNSKNVLVNLTAIDNQGCFHTANKNIAVGTPNPYFQFKDKACVGESVFFASNILNYDSISWEIGGHTFNTDSFYFQVTDTGSFDVSVHAYDLNKCRTLFTSQIPLKVAQPIAQFSADTAVFSCSDYTFNPINQSIGANSYQWNFSQEDSTYQKNPSFIYAKEGIYRPILTAKKYHCKSTKVGAPIEIHHAKADFALSQSNFCLPIQANFTDLSDSAQNWMWYFGDGDSATAKNPTHLYTIFPRKAAELKIVDYRGCKDSIRKELLKVHQAEIYANQWNGCAPLTIQFSDSSVSTSKYWWYFGDGNMDSTSNPQHTYTDTGAYTITLVTQSVEGCFDTTRLTNRVKVGYVEADFFIGSDTSVCAPALTQFSNNSKYAVSYHWNFGDGSGSNLENPLKVYSQNGKFDISLIASDQKGCIDTLVKQNAITINSPKAKFILADSLFCGPQELSFRDESEQQFNRMWFFSDGTTATEALVSKRFDSVKTYQITLKVEDSVGCKQFSNKTLRIMKEPKSNFSLDKNEGCIPFDVSFSNNSTDTLAPSYTWMLNAKRINVFDTILSFQNEAKFDVGLIVENGNGCRDTNLVRNHLKAHAVHIPIQYGFNTLSYNLRNELSLSWKESKASSFKSYKIYHSNPLRDSLIATIENRAQTDLLIGTLNSSFEQCYKIEYINNCVAELGPDSLKAYCSIGLNGSATNSSISLYWTPFSIEGNLNYKVERSKSILENLHSIAVLDDTTLEHQDRSILCPEKYFYRITASYSKGNITYQSKSNWIELNPIANLLGAETIGLQRATIINNDKVMIEWDNSKLSMDVVSGINLYRSKLRSGNEIIAYLPITLSSYMDENVTVDHRSYTYHLELDHKCKSKLNLSQNASSILLKVDLQGDVYHLKWTEAQGMKNGVNKYQIQYQDEFGEWKIYKEVAADQLEETINSFEIE